MRSFKHQRAKGLPLLFAVFIDYFGLALIYPIFSHLLLEQGPLLSGSVSFADRTLLLAFVIASFPLAQIFGAPFFGLLADRFSERKCFFLTLSGGMVGYAITGVGIGFGSLFVMWLGRILSGFFAGNLPVCLAYIQRHHAKTSISDVALASGLGFILALLISSSLSLSSIPSIFYITSILCLVTLILFFLFPLEEGHSKGRSGLARLFSEIKTHHLWPIYLAYFFFSFAWICSIQFLGTYLIQQFKADQKILSIFFLIVGGVWAISTLGLYPRLKMGKFLFQVSLFFFGTTLLLIGKGGFSIQTVAVLFAFAALFASFCWSKGLDLLSKKSPLQVQGGVLGANQSVVAIATVLGPLIGGPMAAYDLNNLYYLTAFSALAACGLLFIFSFGIKQENRK